MVPPSYSIQKQQGILSATVSRTLKGNLNCGSTLLKRWGFQLLGYKFLSGYAATECAISCQVLPPSVVCMRAITSPLRIPPPGSGRKNVRLSASAQPRVGETKSKP